MNWLDSKLELEQEDYKQIKKTELQEFIIKKLYDYKYYENIDFVKKVLDLYFFEYLKNKLQIYIINTLNSNMEKKKKIYKFYKNKLIYL